VVGNRLFVIPFESNNQTQISGCVGTLNGGLCTFDATEHVVTNNNVLSLGIDVDIVRNPQVPDRDLYIFNTVTDQQLQVVGDLGTLLYGITVDSTGNVFIAQTDARNDANGKAGTLKEGLEELENRAFLNQLTRLDCSGVLCKQRQFMELEPLPPVHPAPGQALATPFAIEISDDDATLVVTAAGSDKLFTMDASSGEILGRVAVGAVPRGIALESDGQGKPLEAWVFNAVANSVSLVDVSSPAEPNLVTTIALEDPSHPAVKRGRIAFNDANASTTGTYSCESCHPDGGTDQLLWVLDTPICDIPGCTQIPPRITMPIRGLRDTAPYHWDGIPGDPFGGRNTANINGFEDPNCSVSEPESCTRVLVDGGLASTMCATGLCPINDEGKDGALSAQARDDMAKFLLSVPYPPAQRRSYTNVLSPLAQSGFRLFHIDGDLQGDPEPNVCGNCHRMPFWVSTNTSGTGMEAPTFRGAYDRWLILPQGRLNIIDFNFVQPIAAQGMPERSMWRLSWAGRVRFDPVWDMVLEGSTGFSGSYARQVTLSETTVDLGLTNELLNVLEQSSAEGAVVLQGEGMFIDGEAARPVDIQFDHQNRGGTYVNRQNPAESFSRDLLVSLARDGQFVGTITARSGEFVGVDNPQPALWSPGHIQIQRGRQVFPVLSADSTDMEISARHIGKGANLFVDGKRVPGSITCKKGEFPDCDFELINVQLASLPQPAGMHFLQIQNHDGLFSNDYIIHSNSLGHDNCPDVPNPEQADSDADGVGDLCDDSAFDFQINQGISGAWADPDRAGEGFFVEILSDQKAVVFWFTHTPEAVGGELEQAWVIGIGDIVGSSIVVESAHTEITNGPPFGTDFDPARVDRRNWGKFVLSFSGCDSGVMYYRSVDPDYGNGSQNLTRITGIENLPCGVEPAALPQTTTLPTIDPSYSGSWGDSSHNGEGWHLEILPNGRAVGAWFSYDESGKQAWFIDSGKVDGNTITFDLKMPTGDDFGPTFDPDNVTEHPWGTATISFDSCNSAFMTYDSVFDGYGAGSQTLTRITQPHGLSCQ
jgi:hypothetical protein